MTIVRTGRTGTRRGCRRVLFRMKRTPLATRSTVVSTLATLVLVACGSSPGADPSPTPEEPERPAPSVRGVEPVPSASGPAAGEVPGDLLARIVADAAGRAGVASDELEVVRAEAIIWNDGSLGCPQPGEVYTMALVPGYHVELAGDGLEFDYRATENGNFLLCENAGPPSGG